MKVLWKPGRSLEEDRENQVLYMYVYKYGTPKSKKVIN